MYLILGCYQSISWININWLLFNQFISRKKLYLLNGNSKNFCEDLPRNTVKFVCHNACQFYTTASDWTKYFPCWSNTQNVTIKVPCCVSIQHKGVVKRHVLRHGELFVLINAYACIKKNNKNKSKNKRISMCPVFVDLKIFECWCLGSNSWSYITFVLWNRLLCRIGYEEKISIILKI
jgi:hypothetical protein